MFRRLLRLSLFPILIWAGGSACVWAAEFGRIERLSGEAWVERDGKRIRLQTAAAVTRDDHLLTGPQSRLLLALAHGGKLTLGENASLRISQTLEASAKTLNRLDLKGAFRMVGATAQMPTQRKQEWVVGTPVATIGVRGTDFWGGPLDGALDVVVLSGAVEVINSAGRVVLQPNQGTVVRNASSAPGGPAAWPQDKLQRAFATVAFPEY